MKSKNNTTHEKLDETIVAQYREQLGDISRELSRRIFPLSIQPKKSHHHQIAHAIEAIDLARVILRDIKVCS